MWPMSHHLAAALIVQMLNHPSPMEREAYEHIVLCMCIWMEVQYGVYCITGRRTCHPCSVKPTGCGLKRSSSPPVETLWNTSTR